MTLTDFITEPKSLLIAPAGHGKTYAIASCIKLCPIGEKQLVLTHTHAGISSIKKKLQKLKVEDNKYEEIIARCSFEQLVYEQAILDKEDTILYNKKKALKNEFKKRLEEN